MNKILITSVDLVCKSDEQISRLIKKWERLGYPIRETSIYPDMPYLRFPEKGYELLLEFPIDEGGNAVLSGASTIRRCGDRAVAKGVFHNADNPESLYGKGTFIVENGLPDEEMVIRWAKG